MIDELAEIKNTMNGILDVMRYNVSTLISPSQVQRDTCLSYGPGKVGPYCQGSCDPRHMDVVGQEESSEAPESSESSEAAGSDAEMVD